MGLSRLDNFLKSARGTILYVNPNDLDATDSIENQGNSLTRPFKTIQRALIEASRFSYQKGLNNDRFNKTTVLLYPGDHLVDNRPGWIPDGSGSFRLRSGATSTDFAPFDLTTNFDLSTSDNALHKFNSIHGGVIVPRGTSIVGLDLRKTKIRPSYVPDPTNDNIPRSAIFRVTGGCYFWQFSLFDADPNGKSYIDYTSNQFVPNFSHSKLTCFEYADGVNEVKISDPFLQYTTDRTDLEMYYEKVGLAYGQSSGRPIEPDYPDPNLDIQPKIDEFRIVGSPGDVVGISSIKAGNGVVSTNQITVTTTIPVPGLDVDTAFRISGIPASGYNGQYTVSQKISDTQIVYQVQNSPSVALPSVTGATLTLGSDTVSSASPYIFNISLRSVFGLCGALADGSKASGFKSMVIAQFTGIGLQKDDNAFVVYDRDSGTYQDNTVPGNETLSTNSRAIYKPSYRSFHIKTINDAYVQNVSVFAIGYAEHFSTASGGDQSINNSNSNFGAKALVADGFKTNAFPQDDVGYITHIIPPKQITTLDGSIEFTSLDVTKTVGIASTGNLYIYNASNSDIPPENVLEGYRFGAKENDELKVLLSVGGTVTEYKSRIVMPGSQSSSEKSFTVGRSAGINSITSNTLTLTQSHTFINAESVRVYSDSGQIPDGLETNTVYYVITSDNGNSGLTTTTQIKLAKTENDAFTANAISINSKGGVLKVVSRVSDKNSGDIGHPIQYDETNSQWYVKVSTTATENTIYSAITSLGTSNLGEATPRTFITRRSDNRSASDKIYRFRYVIPASTGGSYGRPPTEGYIIQESNTSIGSTSSEILTYFGSGSLNHVNQQRNFRFISGAEWNSNFAKISTELPHNLSVGSEVELINIRSTSNTSGVPNSGYNGSYSVVGISSAKQFTVGIGTDPGTFTNDTSARNIDLPYFKRKKFKDIYYVFRTQEVQRYVTGQQDGIYYLTVLNASNSPTVAPFTEEKYSQPIKELYPQLNRDNPESDPEEARSFASSSLIGQVSVNDVRKSITKETTTKLLNDIDVGVGITDIQSTSSSSHIIHTNIDHGFNRIVNVSIANSGAGYGSGAAGDIYNARLVAIGASVTGKHATAKLTVNASGNITSVKILDGGSSYGIGNNLAVVGVATTSGYSQAVVTVSQIYNSVDEVVSITGITSETLKPFNTLYRITDVQVGAANSFVVSSASSITTGQSIGIGYTATLGAVTYLTGKSVRIASFNYNNVTGIATVTTVGSHGFRVDNKIRIVGANQSIYNNSFIVDENRDVTTFTLNVGVGTTAPAATGTLYAYREGVTSQNGSITNDNENVGGRMVTTYAGITTTLSAIVSNTTTDEVNVLNIQNLDINIGDYLQIDDEIVRVKTTVTNPAANPIYVFRGVAGTKASFHDINSVVRKVSVRPVELRRHSIIRASAHTFEYLGFGPGNYSTGFPDKQDRLITPEEELLSQSTRKSGGINFYTGMNDKGISYSGNKRLSTITGNEEIFDTPVQTITGEDIGNSSSVNVIQSLESYVSRLIKVDGGDTGKVASEFNGPVVFNNKVTSTSSKGFESNSLYLQGDATISRKYTVGVGTPTLAGNPGDVVYYENPKKGAYLGWVYTVENGWYRVGNVSLSKDANINLFDQIGIGTTSPNSSFLRISNVLNVDSNGVGIGTTTNNGYKLFVSGNTNVSGAVTASYFYGDGSNLTNLNASSTGWTNVAGGIYNTALNSVGIGNSQPQYNLDLGVTGTGNIDLYVRNIAQFANRVDANLVNVIGIITASNFDLQSASGRVTAGIITSSLLSVGAGATVIRTTSTSVGIGTLSPRAKLDIEGHTRLKTYSENVEPLTISSNVVTIDLTKAQTFTLDVTSAINQFILINPPSGSTSFTLKITQNSTGYGVGIDTFRTSGGSTIPVYWPGGGVVPQVTTIPNRTDMYSFKTFDNGATLYGVVGGQNFG